MQLTQSEVVSDESEEYYSYDEDNGVENDLHLGEPPEIIELRDWALDCRIKHAHVDKLLAILKKRLLVTLPKSSKTFLNTSSAKYKIQKLGSGEFVYFGILESLKKQLIVNVHENLTIPLMINVDPVPLYKSSSKNFTPILCKVFCEPDIYKPFVVASYSGDSKLENIDLFFQEFIKEYNEFQNGIVIEGKMFKIVIKCFICDTPARALLKCTKGHCGYNACERCSIHGVYSEDFHRVIYPESNSELRSDASFRNQDDEEHHVGLSSLLNLEPHIDLVKCFVLDFMHLGSLGIMKKLLSYWIIDTRYKLRLQDRVSLNAMLESLRIQVPIEFHRKPRSTTCMLHWKAVEFSFFLLYCGPILLKGILSQPMYQHFLLLHVAFRILCDRKLAVEKNAQAKSYLRKFFDTAVEKNLYDIDFLIMNVHNLLHVADDAKSMNCSLIQITAFPFENLLGQIKSLLRSGNRPLAQLCRRMHELSFSSSGRNSNKISQPLTILKEKTTLNGTFFEVKRLKYLNYTLTASHPDNIVLLKNGSFVQIDKITRPMNNNRVILSVEKLEVKRPIFTYPVDSTLLNEWEMYPDRILNKYDVSLDQVDKKVVGISVQAPGVVDRKKVFVIPLLH